MDKLNELYKNRVSRRNFLAGAGAVGAASVLAGCSDTGTVTTTASGGVTDADILNFALNLEYLEAEFYLRAATGAGLATTDIGAGNSTTGASAGTVTGGTKLTNLTTLQQNIVNEIAFDEQQHVKVLRSALGTAAVARPNIEFTAAFNTLANAAGIATTFNPFADFNSFLIGAFVFEDVGVTAYTGAAGLLSTAAITAAAPNNLLTAAASIQAVEAYHAAYVRTAITAAQVTNPASTLVATANKVVALRSILSGSTATALAAGFETALTVPAAATSTTTTVSPSAIVAADSNALAFGRTVSQVLHIVYGTLGGTTSTAGVKSGLFFPNGLNGNITTTAA